MAINGHIKRGDENALLGALLRNDRSDRAEFFYRNSADQQLRLFDDCRRRAHWENADRAILPGPLCFAKSAVRHRTHFFVIDGGRDLPGTTGMPPSRSSRSCELLRPCLRARKECITDCCQHTAGKRFRFGAIRIARYDQEFFSAPSNKNVRIADCGADSPRHFNQHAVSRVMPVLVVHLFKTIRIDHIEDQIANTLVMIVRIGAKRLAHVCFNGGVEETAVTGPRKRIGQRRFLEYMIRSRQLYPQPMLLHKNQISHHKDSGHRGQ